MNKNAFTLIEVLFAITMASASLIVLASMQSRSLFLTLKDRDEIGHIFFIKKELYQFFVAPEIVNDRKTKKTEFEQVEMKVLSSFGEVEKRSKLAERFGTRISLISSEGSWLYEGRKKLQKIISFVLKLEKRK